MVEFNKFNLFVGIITCIGTSFTKKIDYTCNGVKDLTHIQCDNGRCIPIQWACDGELDCGPGDYSDEINCELTEKSANGPEAIILPGAYSVSVSPATFHHHSVCTDGPIRQMRCSNGHCIPFHWMCDGEPDCSDHSDEENCKFDLCDREPLKYFRCRTGKCIPMRWRCDLELDCDKYNDFSDEENCENFGQCTLSSFTCGNGKYIPQSWKCDGDVDCTDYSDEDNCEIKGQCTLSSFTCGNGKCIPPSWKCDGDVDCTDYSDEDNCEIKDECDVDPANYFRCTVNGFCISRQLVCNMEYDCGKGDHSDEDQCEKEAVKCLKTEFQCITGKCIPSEWKCDEALDCPGLFDWSDEENC